MRPSIGSELPTRRRRAVALTAAAAALAILALPVLGFFPTNLFTVGGLLGNSHQKITETAIEELDAEFFGITDLTKPMKKAIEQIADANAEVDDDQTSSAKHFDGENFAGGQQWIVQTNLPKIKNALAADNAEGARFALGQALHTIQDFYSHSNWVELGNGGPSGSLGRPGAIPGVAGAAESTCQDCDGSIPPFCNDCDANLITARLTSGYYGGEDREKPFDSKCSHGGILDSSAPSIFGYGINKDSIDCAFSPHYNLHFSAAGVAKAATKQFVRDVKDQITERELKLLLGVGPTLAMSIDTTGSMGSVISGVKSQAISIVNARLGTDEEPSKYVLNQFNDPSVGPTTVTKDPDVFKAQISSLPVFGGGDCPELSMSGMLQALSASDEGGTLFMFTDASSKDGSLAGAVSSLATSKDIKVFILTFGSCSPIDPRYFRIVNDSGGQLFELFRSEAGRITQLADFIVRSTAVDILSLATTGPQTVMVPVDSTLERVTFSASGSTAVVVRRPDGTQVLAGDPGVSFVSLSTGALYSIAAPPAGDWTVEINGGSFSLLVSGESDIDLSSFRFVEPGGRPGHEGFFPIDGLPLVGETSMVTAVLSGAVSDVVFELRTKAGDLLDSFVLEQGPGQDDDELSGEVTPPTDSFLVYATGLDANGFPFERVLASSVRPQTIKVVGPAPRNAAPGQTIAYDFEATNLGSAGTFRVIAVDDRGWVRSVAPSFLTLGSGETRTVTVELEVPGGAEPGTSDVLTVTVESTVSEARNFAVVTTDVSDADTTPPTISAVVASPDLLWPPNHKLRPVTLTVDVTDDTDPAPFCEITAVGSDEAIDGAGDGSTDPDWVFFAGSLELELRAERAGGGDGRVYTIEVTCSDAAGNSAIANGIVTVPHDQP